MIGPVEFLNLPGSMSSCEFPLLTGSSQSLTDYTITTFNNVKFSLDLTQTIRVPYFSNYDKANCVRMNNEIYWIVGVINESMADTTLSFAIAYNGPSSIIHKNNYVVGLWERCPDNFMSSTRYQPYSGQTYIDGRFRLPSITGNWGTPERYYYVQISSTEDLGFNTAGTAFSVTDNSVTVDKRQDSLSVYGLICKGNVIDTVKYGSDAGLNWVYPPLNDVLNNIEALGFTASNITNISISERSPYDISYNTGTNEIQFKYGSSVFPKLFYRTDRGYNFVIYNLTNCLRSDWFKTFSQQLSVDSQMNQIGRVTLRGNDGAIIAEVPMAYAIVTNAFKITTLADYSGVYTRVTSQDGKWICNIPEGRLPWVGSTWEEYRAYSMAFDRQSVQNANTKEAVNANANALTGITSGLMTGAIVGGPVGAFVGTMAGVAGIAGAASSYKASADYAKAEQANLEKRMEAQPGTAYSPELGLSYIYQCEVYGASFVTEMPYGYKLNEDWADVYPSVYGYPMDGVKYGLTIKEGYYKGKMLYSSVGGLKFNSANDDLIAGLRFKEV